jgi:hypothetical protein
MRWLLIIPTVFLMLSLIPSAFGQGLAPIEEVSWSALALGIGSIVGVGVGLFLNWRNLKMQNDTMETNLLTSLAHDMSREIEKESKLHTREECILYVITYLDNLSRIAILFEKKHLPNDMKDYFAAYFSYGLTLERFYKALAPQRYEQIGEKRWGRIHEWCKQEKIDAAGDYDLPKIMKELKNNPNQILHSYMLPPAS